MEAVDHVPVLGKRLATEPAEHNIATPRAEGQNDDIAVTDSESELTPSTELSRVHASITKNICVPSFSFAPRSKNQCKKENKRDRRAAKKLRA